MRLLGLEIRRAGDPREAQDTESLRKRVQRLEIAFEELAEAHAGLHGAHVKLRNQFHGSKGGRPADAPARVDAIPVGDKVALRALAGIGPVRTRPFRSTEE